MPTRSERIFQRSSEFLSNRSLGDLVVVSIGSVIIAFANGINKTIATIFDFFSDPFGAVIDGVSGLISSLFGGSALIVDVGAIVTAQDLEMFSIFAFPVAIGIGVAAAAVILSRTLKLETTGDSLTTLFTSIDLPVIGADEDED